MNLKVLTSIFILSLVPTLSSAADFLFSKPENGNVSLSISGEIKPGDYNRFIEYISNNQVTFLHSSTIFLDSPGGDVTDAIKIAEAIEHASYFVIVKQEAVCASACFMLYIGGAGRAAIGKVLIHRPYYSAGIPEKQYDIAADRNRQSAAMKMMRSWLTSKNVPGKIVDTMMKRASNDYYQLTSLDLADIGKVQPEFEETLIRECGVSEKSLIADSEDKKKKACVWKIAFSSRVQFLISIVGEEAARASAEEFIRVRWP